MTCSWKDNWETTKEYFIGWWQRDDLVLCGTPLPFAEPREPVADPGEAPDITYFYTQPEWKARWNHYRLAHQAFPAEVLPIANADIGPGSLALYMGGEAVLADTTVWYKPMIDPGSPRTQKFDGGTPLRFDPESTWWKIQEATLSACAALA